MERPCTRQVPKKLIVIGSGYIGLEFACIFGNLGTETHVVFRGDRPLTGFDGEVLCSPLLCVLRMCVCTPPPSGSPPGFQWCER